MMNSKVKGKCIWNSGYSCQIVLWKACSDSSFRQRCKWAAVSHFTSWLSVLIDFFYLCPSHSEKQHLPSFNLFCVFFFITSEGKIFICIWGICSFLWFASSYPLLNLFWIENMNCATSLNQICNNDSLPTGKVWSLIWQKGACDLVPSKPPLGCSPCLKISG